MIIIFMRSFFVCSGSCTFFFKTQKYCSVCVCVCVCVLCVCVSVCVDQLATTPAEINYLT